MEGQIESREKRAYTHADSYMQRLMWMVQFKNDPVHGKIMQTKDAYMKNDHFDAEEATEAAIDKRKFFIKNFYSKESNDEDV